METVREPTLTLYDRIGGDTTIGQLVERFYDLMFSEPGVDAVRDMHDPDTRLIRAKFFDFLSGWLGGPARYVEKYGHPRLRARHLPFAIGVAERDQWLHCMNRALEQTPMDPALRAHLKQSFADTADFLRNRSET